jgi:hypothetical protein
MTTFFALYTSGNSKKLEFDRLDNIKGLQAKHTSTFH